MLVIFILTLSVLLQFVAAYLAFRLIPLTGRKWAWGLISVALLFMAVRRSIPLFRILSGDTPFRPDLNAELIALAISILMVVGVAMIAPIFTNRKRAEEELRESETRNQIIANLISDYAYIFRVTPQGELRGEWVTESFTKVFGLTREEIDARGGWQSLVYSEDLPLAFEHAQKVAGGQADVCEMRWVASSGEVRWLRDYAQPVFDASENRVVRIYGASQDITERKQAEETLKQSEEKYRYVADYTYDWEYWLTPDGKYAYISPACERISGYRTEEFLQDPKLLEKITHPDDKYRFAVHIQDVLQGKSDACELEFRIVTRDGEECWIGHACQDVYSHTGEYLGRRGSNRDITDRKRAEETLKEKDKFMESMVQNSAVATFVVNAEHKVIYWNRACEDLTGMKSENMLGTSDHWKAFYDHPRPCVADVIIDNKFDEMTNFYKVYAKSVLIPEGIRAEGWYPNLGGKNRYIVFDAAPIHDDNGKLTAAIETLQDITDRKQAEEKLVQTLENLRKALGTTIQVMVSAIEVRDPYTAGHQLRSADLARAIALEMGLPQDTIEAIRMAGPIHDVGKLSVPAEILSKPTKLTEIEFSLIKEHARTGYEMLKDVESPWPLAQIVYQHHERMDGSGYPRNLKGDDILIEARIMAVADVVESMASHRPYRPALGLNAALEEIEKNKGTLYDADAVDACLRLFREKGYHLAVA